MKYCALLLAFFVWSPAHAKLFQNSYLSFEMPDRWNCQMEQTEWVCRSEDKRSSREAVIIFTAKEVGPVDNLTEYENHLKRPKASVNAKGQSVPAVMKQVNRRQVNNLQWVDGLILSSEIPNFYTRYLAATKSKIAVLVTFSAHQRYYTNYSGDFFKAIQSLKITADDSLLNAPSLANLNPSQSSLLGQNFAGVIPNDMLGEDECSEGDPNCSNSGSGDMGDIALLAAVVLLGVGGYFLVKKGKNKGPKGPRG